ncbi:MAG: enoyl-CoA hydratase-related protein [Gammaproteobacteria bacterium]
MTDAPEQAVLYDARDGIATLTLNRPQRANAWTIDMTRAYRKALVAAENDPEVVAVVITGAGKYFCVGADNSSLSKISADGGFGSDYQEPLPEPGDPRHPAWGTTHGMLLSLRKPVIAAVNGAAAGIGFIVMCCSDFRIVAEDAKLTTSVAKLGLPAEFGLSWILPRLVGMVQATDILLRSPVITGREALQRGLANEALPADQVLPRARALAAELIENCSPASLRTIKRQLWLDSMRDFPTAEQDARALMEHMVGAEDFREAMTARNEGRTPKFPRA